MMAPQPTEAARKLLEISGAWTQFKISRGEIHTVASKPAPKEGEAPVEPVAEVAEVEGDSGEEE